MIQQNYHLIYRSPAQVPMNQPNGIERYSPGTELTVGSHQVKVLKYLTSGGYAHVYSVEITHSDSSYPNNVACLKRVVVPDKAHLNSLRAEVETMRILRGNRFVVSYIDSHATKSPKNDGTYEVYLLMEYCSQGGLIDFMNTRLQNRLQEYEVLNIMSQSCQGIAAMHVLEPPLIHRDIKIENVLIAENGDFKVCDFGSVSGVIRAPRNADEFSYVQHDIMKNTTAQYRSPEMLDLYRGLPIDEKSDIWALGVFLYKLCYYTTPFESNGESAILQGRFQFQSYPQYSDRIKNLISVMLRPDPLKRPNICQVLEEISRIQGVPCPIKNFYLARAMSKQPPQILTIPHGTPTPSLVQPITQNKLQQVSMLHQSRSQPVLELYKEGQSISSTVPYSTNTSNTKNDPFSQLDRSSLLKSNTILDTVGKPKIVIPELSYNQSQLNRAQTTSPPRSVTQAKGGRGDISSIVSSNKTSFDKPRYVDSETQTSDFTHPPSLAPSTLGRSTSSASVSSVESLHSISTGGSFTRKIGTKLKKLITGEKTNESPIKSRQNTGDSVKSAFNVLRMGRSSSQYMDDGFPSKHNQERRGHTRSSSGIYSEEQPNGRSYSHKRSTSSLSFVPENNHYEMDDLYHNHRSVSPMRRTSSLKASSSIQKRVKDLLNAKDVPSMTSASGYGKYTESPTKNNLNGHQVTGLEESVQTIRHSSTVITPLTKSKVKPLPPSKPAHLRPTIPPKPKHLRSFNGKQHQMETENNENLSDNESVESDFKRRFPSAL